MPNTITITPANLTLLFSVLRRISFLRTASNETSPVTTEQVKLWLIAERNTIPLFFSPYDAFSGKFQSAHFVLFRNVTLHGSYSTVQIYFIKCLGIIMAVTVSLSRPLDSSIGSIFPLCMEPKALVKSSNDIVASRFFACVPSRIRRRVKICDVVDRFLRKPFWFFLSIFSIFGSMRLRCRSL